MEWLLTLLPYLLGPLIGIGGSALTSRRLTGAQNQQNDWNAQQAEQANQWNQYNYQHRYQWQTQDMEAAGLNTALMYGGSSGVGNVPGTTPASGSFAGNPSDPSSMISAVLDAVLLKSQIKNIEADTRQKNAGAAGQEITNLNLDAQQKAAIASSIASAESSKAETLYKNLLIEYGMPAAEVDKVLNDINVGKSTISRNDAETELAKANAAYTEVLKHVNMSKLPYELASMSASAREAKARAIVDEFRGAYMKQNGTDVPSGTIASLVGLISSTFHSIDSESSSGWDELNTRTLFPFIDLILKFFGR